MDYLKLINEKISVEYINDLVTDPSCGATSFFIGTTRDSFEGKSVLRLEYEAYEDMALKSMKKICNEMRQKWPDLKHIAIYHRLGAVPLREASIIIAVSSTHRRDAIRACEYCIDSVKQSVAIWKKEIYESGEPVWKENRECKWTN